MKHRDTKAQRHSEDAIKCRMGLEPIRPVRRTASEKCGIHWSGDFALESQSVRRRPPVGKPC
jgi:hypothetical protein